MMIGFHLCHYIMDIQIVYIIFIVRLKSLEDALKTKDESLKEYQEKFMKLKEDFKYNLKLLKSRDEELEVYDANLGGLERWFLHV